MPDLSHDGVHQFWKDYPDGMIYRVVSFMEGVEHWTVDEGPEFETAMQGLADSLETLGNYELGQQQDFITLCTYLKMARMLRVLQTVDTAHPGGASKILMYAEENSSSSEDVPGIFLRRNIVFERLRLLGRVFANERIAIVMKALGSEKMIMRYGIALSLLLGSTLTYADSISTINQINSNADRIAAQAQNNMMQQQQVLAQRLQALSKAMQAQMPDVPMQPFTPVQVPAPVQAVTATPPAATTQQGNITGFAPASRDNNSNNSNQWNYGF